MLPEELFSGDDNLSKYWILEINSSYFFMTMIKILLLKFIDADWHDVDEKLTTSVLNLNIWFSLIYPWFSKW